LKQARCRLGFEKRVDAAIYRSASKAEVGSQSSEHGVVATGEHVDPSGCLFVERHVRLLSAPEVMKQHGKLAGYGNDGLTFGLLAASAS
jgi:hypothetical protein